MKISSPAFSENETIPKQFSCDGNDVSPTLIIDGVPATAKSLVLIVDDPDAPAGDWVHWILWNIPPTISKIDENSFPDGAISGTNDFGRIGYGGPCPPAGSPHHYHFKLYALDVLLNLSSSAKKADITETMIGHILASSDLIGLYGR